MTRPLLNRRLNGLGNSIFGEMSARAVATASINLGQGFPDVDGPRSVADAAAEAILAGRGNQYPPPTGIPELRQAVARHQQRFYGLGYNPDTEVLITAGATEAIAAALLALLQTSPCKQSEEQISLEQTFTASAIPCRSPRDSPDGHAPSHLR